MEEENTDMENPQEGTEVVQEKDAAQQKLFKEVPTFILRPYDTGGPLIRRAGPFCRGSNRRGSHHHSPGGDLCRSYANR